MGEDRWRPTPETPGDAVGLRAENARLREANERLRLMNENRDGVIADLRARNDELGERAARLERLISRDSGNSPMPPRCDDLPGKKPPVDPGAMPGMPVTCRRPGDMSAVSGVIAPGTVNIWDGSPPGRGGRGTERPQQGRNHRKPGNRRCRALRSRDTPQTPFILECLQAGQGDQQPAGEHQLVSWPGAGPPARHRLREDAVRRAATARPGCPRDR